jgi:signal transduction histidine kinase
MRIATRLKLSSFLSLGALIVMIPVLVWAFIESGTAKRNNLFADEIQKNVFERTYLRDEYLLHNEARARIQWHVKKDMIGQLLQKASTQFKNSADRTILKEMTQNYDDTVVIFSRIEKLRGNPAAQTAHAEIYQSMENRLFTQLLVKAYSLHEATTRFQEAARAKVDATYSRVVVLTFIFIVMMALATMLNSAFINKLLSRRLAALERGARIISGGNLAYRITYEGSDELTDLTETINSMTKNLAILYASLEDEMAQGKRATEEIQKLNEHLEQYTQQLEAANKELEAFSYSVSHDLRAPLRHITGFVEMLDKRGTVGFDEKSRHYMNVISDSAQKMGNLIDDLLSFSRMGRTEMMKSRTSMVHLVHEVLNELQIDAKETDIEFDIKPLPEVYGDPSMLRLVLVNLISNAVKFSHGRKPIRIEINYRDDTPTNETVFYVRDNGVGFDMKYVDKLFGLFQRLHSPSDFEGTGVGLANVRRIIHRHGGRTWADGAVDKGATFFFSLPDREEG